MSCLPPPSRLRSIPDPLRHHARTPRAQVYEGLTYKLSLTFPAEYPYVAPVIRFVTPCFHPNVDAQHGSICLDILKDKWSAAYSVSTILMSLRSLLGEPNNESPLNSYAAQLWSNPEGKQPLFPPPPPAPPAHSFAPATPPFTTARARLASALVQSISASS
jgi:hypothetical protein